MYDISWKSKPINNLYGINSKSSKSCSGGIKQTKYIEMDRRAAIKNIGVSFGSITLSSGVLSIIQSCQTNDLNWTPKFFTAKRIGFMDRMLEIIIPETDTPGAISLNLSKFIDAHVHKNISSKNQSELNQEIDEFMNFILKNENKNTLNDIDNIKLEKYLSNHLDSDDFTESNGKNYSKICSLLREMGVSAYKLTEYVMTNKLGYVPIPGYYDGNVDV
jgi:hypothetical protein